MPTIRERNGRFQSIVRVKAGGVIVHNQTETFDTYKQAYVWGCGIEENFKAGVLASSNALQTVADVAKAHRSSIKDAGKDVRGISNSLKHIEESKLIGNKPIVRVTTSDVVAWGKDYGKTRAPGTVLHALMVLRSMYGTARNELNIKVDVQVVADAVAQLNKLGIAAKSTERDRRVTNQEIDQICTHHESLMGTTIPLRICLNLAIALPRRSGELFGKMRWENYDGETVKLFDTKDPKKVRNEVVPVPPKARAIIELLPRSKSGPILDVNNKSVSHAVFDACRLLGIEDLHLHDLRHEGVSRLFEAGLDIPRVAMISGHQSWATLRRYTHLKPADVVERLTV
jgi:integrase